MEPSSRTVTQEDDVATVIETVDLISKKWHPALIQTLLEGGPLRFSELKTSLDGISGKVLTDSLDDLVDKGLVERRVISESPRKVEYELTAHGRDLQQAIEALADWGDQHLGEQTLPKALVVDDDPRLARMHGDWLESAGWEVSFAADGKEALRELSDDVDVVLLDRRMPMLSGEEVLARINDLDLDCMVLMLTAVDPDFDVIEMGFDGYLVKPGTKDQLVETVEDLLARESLDEEVREYLALVAKRRVLETETSAEDREESDAYDRLLDRLKRVEAALEETDDEEGTGARTIPELLTDDS